MVGSAESLNAAACHDVMFSTSSNSEKFGWFAGAVVYPVVSSFISDRVELSNTPNPAVCHTLSYCMYMLNETVDFWIVFPGFESERLDMSQLNVNCSRDFRNQVLPEGPSNKTPTLICRCLQAFAEALKINKSITNIDLRWNQIGAEGAKAWCVVGSAESLNAAACHDVMFSTSSNSEKFGWFAGAVVYPVVSSFISDRVELSNTPNPAVCHTLSYCM